MFVKAYSLGLCQRGITPRREHLQLSDTDLIRHAEKVERWFARVVITLVVCLSLGVIGMLFKQTWGVALFFLSILCALPVSSSILGILDSILLPGALKRRNL